MKIDLLSASTIGIVGLVTAGLLALPVTATAADDDGIAKRDETSTYVVLVDDADDDDDDDAVTARRADVTDADRSKNTRSRDDSRTGSNSGRDNSRANSKLDWTHDGAGKDKRDWSMDRTNDRSRNNTSR